MTSTVRGDDNFDSAVLPQGRVAQAWVNFNGTGTPTIRDQHNVSSLVDNGAGDWTLNFSNALADTNYCPVLQSTGFSVSNRGAGAVIHGDASSGATLKSTTQLRVQNFVNTTGLGDAAEMNVAIFGGI